MQNIILSRERKEKRGRVFIREKETGTMKKSSEPVLSRKGKEKGLGSDTQISDENSSKPKEFESTCVPLRDAKNGGSGPTITHG